MTPRGKRIQRMREAFASIDKEDARRISEQLPEFDLTQIKPGQVVAIHYPMKRPGSKSSQKTSTE